MAGAGGEKVMIQGWPFCSAYDSTLPDSTDYTILVSVYESRMNKAGESHHVEQLQFI